MLLFSFLIYSLFSLIQVFADLFDPVIDERHNGYPKTAVHPTDLDASKLNGGHFDGNYVLSTRVRTGRSIRGLSLPPACTRAERRAVEEVRPVERTDCTQSTMYVPVYTCMLIRWCRLCAKH